MPRHVQPRGFGRKNCGCVGSDGSDSVKRNRESEDVACSQVPALV